MAVEIKGEIKVASRIVDYLSSGLYNSPAACLKELVNNSYDADANRVDVFVKPDADRIVVADDGLGMTASEFQRHFERVSESHKRDDSDVTPSGRKKIGKIGIGFIAANELCDVMEIVSTTKGSTELLQVEINFSEMRLEPALRRREGDDFVKGDYEGTIGTATKDDHYTHVLLKEVRSNAKGILAGARKREHVAGKLSIYGARPETVRDLIASASDWGDFDEYSQAMLRIGLNVPVRYLPDWYPKRHKKTIEPLEKVVADGGFAVCADGSDLRKPVMLNPGDRNILKPLEIDGEHVAATGYFFARHGVLRPQWLTGVLIRIRNGAVGEYDPSFLGYKSNVYQLFQRWASCELWADDRLEEALNIDRRTLRITHPAYVELQEAFHDELSDFFREVRRKLYSGPAAERRQTRAHQEVDRLGAIIERSSANLPPPVRKELRAAVKRVEPKPGSSARDLRAVLRSYSVAEVYELALEVAHDTLSPPQYEKFARELAKRLLG